jgi:NAD(P)-dependent dehydrogenase (short-subunit alcohol dehydrogenase family)
LDLISFLKMPPSFQNKIILITGAGSGIGRGTNVRLAQLGATLALTDINSTSLAETLDLCPSKETHFTSAFDVSSSEKCDAFIAAIISKYSSIDHTFNCAGINGVLQATVSVTDAYWDRMFATNVKGFFNITRACIPHLKSGASFVNMTSNFGITPGSGYAVYCATKAAAIGFSKSVALELGPKGIRTNIVAAGAIRTPTNVAVLEGEEALQKLNSFVSLGRIGGPEDIADVVAFLFSDEARYMNGSVVEVNGGFF